MRKLVFAALAGVFMLSSGFGTSKELNKVEIFGCNCACLEDITVQYGDNPPFTITLRSYTNGSQACGSLTNGNGSYDSSDCQNGAGMLNAKNAAELREAESGSGC